MELKDLATIEETVKNGQNLTKICKKKPVNSKDIIVLTFVFYIFVQQGHPVILNKKESRYSRVKN